LAIKGDPALLTQLSNRLGATSLEIEPLGGFENRVLGVRIDNRAFVLRLSDLHHRTEDEVRAELDWLRSLSGSGVPVAAPLRLTGREFERLEYHGAECIAVFFEWLPGHSPRPSEWSPDLFTSWGTTVGRLHALSRSYEPPVGRPRRPNWRSLDKFAVHRHVQSDDMLRDLILAWMDELEAPDAATVERLLVHGDLGLGNLHVHAGQLAVFDFDDCVYASPLFDVAAAMIDVLATPEAASRSPELPRALVTCFCAGYRGHSFLDPGWQESLLDFFRLHVLELYVAGCRKGLDQPWRERWARLVLKGGALPFDHGVRE
jgi:Ser/Thr protein kinase RdoA (MazF antagonist)